MPQLPSELAAPALDATYDATHDATHAALCGGGRS
jgi:hypothetical protein